MASSLTKCHRCNKEISSRAIETCWYCGASLCFECWEEFGHCGHIEAKIENEAIQAFRDEFVRSGNVYIANLAYRTAKRKN